MTHASDDCLSFEDASLVYVRDKRGVLTSPPGYEKSSKRDDLRECDKVHGASCVKQLGSSLPSPHSLFQICKNFVAQNLHLLESLHDFPETIGHELFQEALQVNTFHKNSDYLKIFCEAYENLVLKDLCLREATTLINKYMNYFQCFNNLTMLDLSHCRLGNKHEYLTFIGKMKSLEYLYLKDNCLTDTGLAAWSLPHRMLQTGPELLKVLDLSCNPDLTGFCLKSLSKFTHLKSLNLSGTGVSLTPGIERFKKLMNFSLVSYIKEFSMEVSTVTSGWAASFISELSSKLNERMKKVQFKTSSTGNFYRRPSASVHVLSGKINTNIYPVVLLQSVSDVLPGTLRTLSESKMCRGKKRLVTNGECQTLKRQKISNDNLEELNDTKLLDSYLKYL